MFAKLFMLVSIGKVRLNYLSLKQPARQSLLAKHFEVNGIHIVSSFVVFSFTFHFLIGLCFIFIIIIPLTLSAIFEL